MVIKYFINKLTFFPAFLDIICCLTIFEKKLENCEQTLPAGFDLARVTTNAIVLA